MANRKPVTAGPALSELKPEKPHLLVLDIDEVVLQFIDPFVSILNENGATLHPEEFKLTGSAKSMSTGQALGGNELKQLVMRLYDEQETRQPLVPGAASALANLSEHADIVFLTAMTPSYHARRRQYLDASGLNFPMIATERPKGSVIHELAQLWTGPIAFVDDLPSNLAEVRRSAPDTGLLHFMASKLFWPYLPALPSGVQSARTWPQAETMIRQLLGHTS
ncbi:hypothetical protein FPY71_06200 [Aureimonas fodinaquatilis]|uniref:HAD family hydrolase n=1 Tax=Aureimonas fodinaquatilis TaxID=2565783 RepID=A0A5B0DUI4_9HYPH|nr:hypothetical protein [Aureimonas fodinaquatilis]KAA0970126.1 hypothetical protein FPY71_06200 [Aureimonas fodinaquatilis]